MSIAVKETRIIVLAIIIFCGILILLLLPRRELTVQEKVNALKPRDFYLVYQYYFDPEIIRLRKEIEHHEMVRNKEVGQDKGL